MLIRSSTPGFLLLACVVSLGGCKGITTPKLPALPGAAVDGGDMDGGAAMGDGAVAISMDGGDIDAGMSDGSVDGGATDGGVGDGGPDDGGPVDGGAVDGGAGDGGAVTFIQMGMAGACCDQAACDLTCAAQGKLCSNDCTCFDFIGQSQCQNLGCPRGEVCNPIAESQCNPDAGAMAIPNCVPADGGWTGTIDGGTCCDLVACKLTCGESACTNGCKCAAATNPSTGNIACTADADCPRTELCYSHYCIPGASSAQGPGCSFAACDPHVSNNVCPAYQACGANGLCQ